MKLTESFLSAVDRAVDRNAPDTGALETTLQKIAQEAEAAWPEVSVAPERYVVYLAGRLPDDTDVIEALGRLCSVDLYLACACTDGNEQAVAALERSFEPAVKASLTRFNASSVLVAEVLQQLKQKLFVSERGTVPDIAKYSGRGALKTWLRIVAAHMAMQLIKKEKLPTPNREDLAALVADDSDDPELGYLKRYYKEKFRTAFQSAVSALSSRDRNLLRYQLMDGLSIDDIGRIYHVHRATAARWLVKVRQQLADRTRDLMIQSEEVSEYEYESILRIIQTQLDFTIGAYLKTDASA